MKTASPSSITAVRIPCGRVAIHGELTIPDAPKGLVIFAHAIHGGWTDSRNWPIAWELDQNGDASLLLDLLTPDEASHEHAKGFLRLEVPLLAQRLVSATRWALQQEALKGLRYAYFGSEAAGAAALEAAIALPATAAVVCRAARTDLTSREAEQLRKPVLLLVGEIDRRTQRWNREFAAGSPSTRRVEVVPGASHSFPEEGALRRVAGRTVAWLRSHLRDPRLDLDEVWA